MRDDPYVIALVTRAAKGDESAWNEIVERYAPLMWSICTRFQLGRHDSEDVAQTVWKLLVEQLGKLREPAALPGWLATTTANECRRVVKTARKCERLGTMPEEAEQFVDPEVIDQELLLAEQNAVLRAALAELLPRCQQLLTMLFLSDPPRSYAEISATLNIPVGSIGPQQGRCLKRLRECPILIALVEGDRGSTDPGGEPGA